MTGKNFSKVSIAKVEGSTNHSFTIETKSDDTLILNAKSALNFLVGETLNLIVSSANASATFPITFELQNGQVTAAKLHHMGASSGQFLRFNGTNWVPSSISSSQVFAGAYDALTDTPDIASIGGSSGTYYIVTVAGSQDLGSGMEAFDVGDWVIFDGTTWSRLAVGTNTVSGFNGRTGLVVPLSGDYSWSMLTKAAGKLTGSKVSEIADVDVTGIQDGDILQWNLGTSKWEVNAVPAPAIGAGTITNTEIANSSVDSNKISDGSIVNADVSATAAIAQSKIQNLTTDLLAKEPTIATGTTAQYIRGNKTLATLDSSVVPESGNLYFTPARVLSTLITTYATGGTGAIAVTDTVPQALSKLETKTNSLSNYVLLNGTVAMTGNLQMGAHKITGLADPTVNTDAATKAYVDSVAGSVSSQWTTAGSDIYYDTGKVGVGTTSPQTSFHVNSAANTTLRISSADTSKDAQIEFMRGAAGTWVGPSTGTFDFWSQENIPMLFAVNDDEKMRIAANGNIGIGTTAPSEKLDVAGNIALTGNLRLKSDNANYVTLRAPVSLAATFNYTFPLTAPTAGQVLSSSAAGVMSWISIPSAPVTTVFGRTGAVVATAGDYTATLVTNTPAGNISASTVQTAITELDSEKQAVDATLTSLAAYNTNGILVQTAADSFTGRSIAGVANRTAVTNGNGVSGNPTVDVNTTLLPSPVAGDVGNFLKATAANTSVWTALASGDITAALGFTPINKAGDTISSGTIDFNGVGILKLSNAPVNLTDAVNKQYVDTLVATGTNQWTVSGANIYRSSGNVGIGTTSPAVPFSVNATVPSTALHPHRAGIQAIGEGTDVNGRVSARVSSSIESPMFTAYKSDGTLAAPTAVSAGQGFGQFSGFAYNGSDYISGGNASMQFTATQNHTASAGGSKITFWTTDNNTNFSTEKMVIDQNGSVGIGTTAPIVSSAGRTYLSIQGSTDTGVLELGSGAADADQAIAGLVQWSDKNSVAADKRVVFMTGLLDGTTANNRGGAWRVSTKADGVSVLTERMRITSTGNVGIGTSSPTSKLEVNGAVKIGTSAPIGRMTICSYATLTGTTVAAYNVHNWIAAECSKGIPNSTCVGYISKSVISGQENNLSVLNPNESVFPGCPGSCTANANGGFGFSTDTAASGTATYDIRAVYMCEN